jgi:hypothetical protein
VDRYRSSHVVRTRRIIKSRSSSQNAQHYSLSQNRSFCDGLRSPAARRRDRVHNPCPKSTSHNRPCHRVLRPSSAWATCSATPASPPPTSNHTSRSTPSLRPAATGLHRTASGARADRPVLEQVLDQLRPGDTLVVWKLGREPSGDRPHAPAVSRWPACSRRRGWRGWNGKPRSPGSWSPSSRQPPAARTNPGGLLRAALISSTSEPRSIGSARL